MILTVLLLVVEVLSLGLMAQGQELRIPSPDKDPFVGHWRANAKKSRPQLKRSFETAIRRDGDYVILISDIWISKKGELLKYKIRCDGLFYRLPWGNALSCAYHGPDRVDGETVDRNGSRVAHSFWSREVSRDAREMTISFYEDRSRSKLVSVVVLDRIE